MAETSTAGRRVRVIGGPIVIEDATGVVEVPPGNPQRLVGVVVANGGVATFDQVAEALWSGDDVEHEPGAAPQRAVTPAARCR